MKHTVETLENRIHKLSQKDVVGNAKLIAKIKRKIRAIEKEKAIFGNIKRESLQTEPFIQLTEYGEIIKKQIEEINSVYDDANIYPYVIMPNHIHFIVEIDGSSGTPTPTNARIPKIVSTFKRMTNKKIGFKIWQRGYNDHIIRNDEDYLRVAEYIINNPYGKTW